MKQTKAIVEETERVEDIKSENNVHKERFLGALKQNENKLDEEELGQSIGFSRAYTDKIINELIEEGKITRHTAGTCRYKANDE